MKHGCKWILGMIVFSVIITVVLMQFMPDRIPAHYNAAGVVDRMGSKYESLLWPVTTAFMGGFFLLMTMFVKTASEKKVLHIVGIVMELFSLALGVYFMVKSIAYDPSLTASDINADIGRMAGIAIGIVLIVLGNFMPKISRNKLFGLRTTWTLKSDVVWQKSNRFCGISGVVCGLLMVLSAALLPSSAVLIICGLLFAAWVIASLIASYRYYRVNQTT